MEEIAKYSLKTEGKHKTNTEPYRTKLGIYACYVLANLRLRCSNVLILIFIPYNAGVFRCAIDLDFLLTRDRVEASQKKKRFQGRGWRVFGSRFYEKKNACSAGYEINSTPELYFCLLFGRDFVNRRSFVSWKLELVINENKVLSWWN